MSLKSQSKRKSKNCSCLDMIIRAFTKQQSMSQHGFSAKSDINSQNKGGAVSYATTTGTTIHYTTHGGCDLSNATFINRIKSQKSAKNENNIALVEGPKNEQVLENLQGSFLKQFAAVSNQNQIQQQENSNNEYEEGYVFKFQQRYEYLHQKFATKEGYHLNGNCKTIYNFAIQTMLKGPEIKYCQGINGNYFLLKYFKYECSLCLKLCSHILVANCCLSPICLNCSQELAEHYQETGPVKKCIFCSNNIANYYIFRDPDQSEQKFLFQKCKETISMVENKKKGKKGTKKRQRRNIQQELMEEDSFVIDIPVLEESAVKPKKLDFIENSAMQTAGSNNKFLDVLDMSYSNRKNHLFDDMLTIQEESPQRRSTQSSGLKNQYSTKICSTSKNMDACQQIADDLFTIKEEHSGIKKESKPKIAKSMNETKKRLGNKRSCQQIIDEDMKIGEDLPITKRLRKRNTIKTSVDLTNSSQCSSNQLSRQSKKIKK